MGMADQDLTEIIAALAVHRQMMFQLVRLLRQAGAQDEPRLETWLADQATQLDATADDDLDRAIARCLRNMAEGLPGFVEACDAAESTPEPGHHLRLVT